jgi:demethylmenaquinone methyltransferase / 2-methoxy-6-polyprenyl-1,4-benzoquinol methylase
MKRMPQRFDPESSKRPSEVRRMFRSISAQYDLTNMLMTFGFDRSWRRHVVSAARLPMGGRLLDLGAGTGGIAMEALARDSRLKATAADFTLSMMLTGRKRDRGRGIMWCSADALNLPFPDATFDAVTSGFLIRNVVDVRRAFEEQARVVRPGGHVVCLDTSPPPANLLRPFILFHIKVVIPMLGRWVTGDGQAYAYLRDSTRAFMTPEGLASKMAEAGLRDISIRRFMFGAAAVVQGRRLL